MELLIGIFLPPIIDMVNRQVKSEIRRFLFACLLSVVVGAILALPQLMNGETREVAIIAGIIFVQAQFVFKIYWKKSFVRSLIIKPEHQVGVEDRAPLPVHVEEIAKKPLYVSPPIAGQVVENVIETPKPSPLDVLVPPTQQPEVLRG